MEKEKSHRLVISSDSHKLLQYASKKSGYRIQAIGEQAINEWLQKRGMDPEEIRSGKSWLKEIMSVKTMI